ncbi:hypothetical protein IJ556_04070 [bacterium]|nr:hypothetical protein [bacterium]
MKTIIPNISKETIKAKTTSILKNLVRQSKLAYFEYSFWGNSAKEMRLDTINLTNGKPKESFDRVVVPLLNDLYYGLSDWVSREFEMLNPRLKQECNNKEYANEYVDDILTTGKVFTCEEWVEIICDSLKISG